jgi:hypothetical protein
MGYLRTAYQFNLQLWPGGPYFRARWYRAHPKAKLFPGIHMGLSRNWFNYRTDIGESGFDYDKGVNVRNTKGQCYRGKAEWFALGMRGPEDMVPQPDQCTSCPGRGPIIGFGPRSSFELTTWTPGPLGDSLNFGGWFDTLTITGGGPYDGTYTNTNGGVTVGWNFVLAGGVDAFVFGWPSDPELSIVDGVTALVPFDDPVGLGPWEMSADVVTDNGNLPAGSRIVFRWPLVRPVYYNGRPPRFGVAFDASQTYRPVWLQFQPLNNPFTPPAGPSGFDDGFDDGFGGEP